MTDAIDDLDIDEHTAACALLDDGPHAGGAQPRRARRTAGPTPNPALAVPDPRTQEVDVGGDLVEVLLSDPKDVTRARCSHESASET